MDVFSTIKERRSCRDFSPEPLSDEIIDKIIEAAVWAPSPLNLQPWEFFVISNQEVKDKIHAEAERCRRWAIEQSGWKWLNNYNMDFLRAVPVIIGVVGNPQKSGVDQFMEDGGQGYQHACAAAVQNMQLAAHAAGLGSLWFTFYDKNEIQKILGAKGGREVIALVCLGQANGEPAPVPRKSFKDKTTYIS